ncbi:Transient receptor potential cation channel subfamily V member 6 [Trichinella pseudospiralis]|uniref:Transient receptor potential cation channel subfamily V member 6 n=3 Tax=Trichinella pseudospiralis TaxID=6337 RepID=A0A0V1JGL4_TRIPS|nr:Transient receptor potential cation channel subfamily V member 6 [Trichinella pseudospiralis]KRZ34147.1 Transient receptor potential cation channel subfamily V member 6 [Trichinella pseudospiralis]
MGNTPTTSATANLVIGIKRAQESKNSKLYRLVDYNGEGELIQWMKYSMSIGDYNILDGLIELKITPFLYGGGKGKLVPISELVKMRNDERNALLSTLRRKKGKGKSGPNILENVNQDNMQGDMMKALKRLDGGGGKQGGASKYRELCWDISQRGAMGETLVHICLLNGTHLHNEVAKILIRTFPKLVNDIYLSEEYYGQSPLHQAIVNEDIAMVRFLLQHGADVHQRCYGAFFCPDDQKESRTDSLEHEWVDIHQNTNYAGRTYWGEYPLSFAACTRQPDCCRMLKAAKADLNMRDTNGNTVLHLMVIHELPDIFDLLYKLGAKLHIKNNQNLTPLTLAAKLGKKQMFNHVLNYEKEELWTYGSVTWIAYPLSNIDTIEEQTGDLMPISALSLIVFGETSRHLQLIDGLIENVLEAKWKAFGKRRFATQLFKFIIYFAFLCSAVVLRPTTYNIELPYLEAGMTPMNINVTCCRLLKIYDYYDLARVILEICTICGAVMYVIGAAIQIKRITWKLYIKSLASFPGLCSFWISFLFLLLSIIFRLTCSYKAEFYTSALAVLMSSFNFLFFLRSNRLVGPFVIMFYKMMAGDVFRFLLIYVIFLFGFSQAFFIIFLGCHRGMNTTEILSSSSERMPPPDTLAHPLEAMARLFMVNVGEFQILYKVLDTCRLATLGKFVFIFFQILVSLLLINMFIASMTRTYEAVNETQMEWKRQWAQVILMLEQSINPKQRLAALLKYSRPKGIDRKRRAFVVMTRCVKKATSPDEEETENNKSKPQTADVLEKKKIAYKKNLVNNMF